MFVEAGYDTHELLVEIQCSLRPLTNKQLESEVKISNENDRLKILNRLEKDISRFYQEIETNKIAFDEPKRIVCETCNVF